MKTIQFTGGFNGQNDELAAESPQPNADRRTSSDVWVGVFIEEKTMSPKTYLAPIDRRPSAPNM